eukprot:scaffold7549_cov111-Isochrysis_galbana.AAC.14
MGKEWEGGGGVTGRQRSQCSVESPLIRSHSQSQKPSPSSVNARSKPGLERRAPAGLASA